MPEASVQGGSLQPKGPWMPSWLQRPRPRDNLRSPGGPVASQGLERPSSTPRGKVKGDRESLENTARPTPLPKGARLGRNCDDQTWGVSLEGTTPPRRSPPFYK